MTPGAGLGAPASPGCRGGQQSVRQRIKSQDAACCLARSRRFSMLVVLLFRAAEAGARPAGGAGSSGDPHTPWWVRRPLMTGSTTGSAVSPAGPRVDAQVGHGGGGGGRGGGGRASTEGRVVHQVAGGSHVLAELLPDGRGSAGRRSREWEGPRRPAPGAAGGRARLPGAWCQRIKNWGTWYSSMPGLARGGSLAASPWRCRQDGLWLKSHPPISARVSPELWEGGIKLP